MKEKLLELNEIAKKYNESIMSEVSEKQFSNFTNWISSFLIENDYKDFLKLYEVANGFEFNGLVVYSLDESLKNNIYNSNEEWHGNKDLKQYLFFGDSDITWYCYSLNNKVFCELDKPSATLMETYENFNDFISAALDSIM